MFCRSFFVHFLFTIESIWCFTGGHGTHNLYKADVPLLSNEICSYLMDRPIPDTEVCAGRKHGGVDSCQVMICLF
jgi:hypothetical protein